MVDLRSGASPLCLPPWIASPLWPLAFSLSRKVGLRLLFLPSAPPCSRIILSFSSSATNDPAGQALPPVDRGRRFVEPSAALPKPVVTRSKAARVGVALERK